METSVKQRLKEYIKYKGIPVRLFESTCGLSYGYVSNMRVSIQPDKVSNIARHYPDLNTGWLLTGEGEMLKEKNGISDKHQVTIVPQKSHDKLQENVYIYNVEARMGLISLYDTGKAEIIGEVSFPNMPKSDAAIIARGDSMYPLIKSGSVVAFRRLHNFDFFVPGEIYIVNFSERYSEEDNFTRGVNKGFNSLCAAIGINRITSYYLRHAWATIAKNQCGASTELVAFCLNHASAHKVTELYIVKDFTKIDTLNQQVIERIVDYR